MVQKARSACGMSGASRAKCETSDEVGSIHVQAKSNLEGSATSSVVCRSFVLTRFSHFNSRTAISFRGFTTQQKEERHSVSSIPNMIVRLGYSFVSTRATTGPCLCSWRSSSHRTAEQRSWRRFDCTSSAVSILYCGSTALLQFYGIGLRNRPQQQHLLPHVAGVLISIKLKQAVLPSA